MPEAEGSTLDASARLPNARGRCRKVISPDGFRPSDLLAAFFALALAFLLAAAVVALIHTVDGWAPGRWLALHLAFVGGVSQLVLGASQFFVGAFLATDPPPRRLVRAQLVVWNLGTVLVAIGVTWGHSTAVLAGACLLLLGLLLFASGFRSMQRRSLQRAPWAARWYYASAAFLSLGVIVGVLLARGVAWPAGSLLGAHLALNIAGWFGAAIVGTLHTFYPSLTQTRLRFPRLQPLTFAAWVAGTIALAGGYFLDTAWLAVAGWTGLTLAGALLAVNLLASTRRAPTPMSLPARLVGVGQCFLVAGLLIGLIATAGGTSVAALGGAGRSAVGVLLLAGWLGLTVLGSLLHLLSVLARVRDLRLALPRASRVRDASLPPLAAAAVVGLATAQLVPLDSLLRPATVLVILVYAILAARVIALAAVALRRTRMGA